MTKQVIVMRKDLNMRKGKMVAQGAHASMKAILDEGTVSKNAYKIPLTNDMFEWLNGSFTKICVSVDSEEELKAIYNEARKYFIPCSIIKDNGLTEFNGVPTYTAVAIGPAKNHVIDAITGKLKLL